MDQLEIHKSAILYIRSNSRITNDECIELYKTLRPMDFTDKVLVTSLTALSIYWIIEWYHFITG